MAGSRVAIKDEVGYIAGVFRGPRESRCIPARCKHGLPEDILAIRQGAIAKAPRYKCRPPRVSGLAEISWKRRCQGVRVNDARLRKR